MSNRPSKLSSINSTPVVCGARSSLLSRLQVKEVQDELQKFHPEVRFDPVWVNTTGDRDLTTSLRELDKTNFFTKEIDELVLAGDVRIGIHSAKDLPDPLPRELCILAVTKGLDPSDSLVFRKGETLRSLPTGAKIATSSLRREEAVRKMRSDFTFVDLRGTIEKRLEKLDKMEADGVVVAESALIRLGLTHLNRIPLPDSTVVGQGQLVVVGRAGDEKMKELFYSIDCRKRVLYLGLNARKDTVSATYIPFPVIQIVPRNLCDPEVKKPFERLPFASHVVFTSKNSVSLFFDALNAFNIPLDVLSKAMIIAVGVSTSRAIERHGIAVHLSPKQETAEGIVKELSKLDLNGSRFFWPRSSLARPVLKEFLYIKNVLLDDVILYDTKPALSGNLPHLDSFDHILFTSPSTVDALLHFFKGFPQGKVLSAIGYVTAKYLTGSLIKLSLSYTSSAIR